METNKQLVINIMGTFGSYENFDWPARMHSRIHTHIRNETKQINANYLINIHTNRSHANEFEYFRVYIWASINSVVFYAFYRIVWTDFPPKKIDLHEREKKCLVNLKFEPNDQKIMHK